MRKYLPLVVLAVAFFIIVGMSCYTYPSNEAQQDDTQKGSPVAISPTDVGHATGNTKTPKSTPYIAILFAWPHGVETLALIATLFVVAWQATLMAEHAEHLHKVGESAADNAKAAASHAQAIISSERPWILVQTEVIEGSEISAVYAKNCGRTPAKIVIFSGENWAILPASSELPLAPKYEGVAPLPTPMIVLPEGSTYIATYSEAGIRRLCGNDERYKRVQNGDDVVYIFGVVHYQDLLNSPEKAFHETGWCVKYIPTLPKNRLLVSGEAEYNYYT